MFKKLTFWMAFISLVIIFNHLLANDQENIFLIGLHPILHELIYIEPYRGWMMGADYKILFPTYLLHFITFFIFGLFLDLTVSFIRKYRDNKSR